MGARSLSSSFLVAAPKNGKNSDGGKTRILYTLYTMINNYINFSRSFTTLLNPKRSGPGYFSLSARTPHRHYGNLIKGISPLLDIIMNKYVWGTQVVSSYIQRYKRFGMYRRTKTYQAYVKSKFEFFLECIIRVYILSMHSSFSATKKLLLNNLASLDSSCCVCSV